MANATIVSVGLAAAAVVKTEPGNRWLDCSPSLDDPNEFVFVEAFEDDAAEAHVKSDHFQTAIANDGPMHSALTATPKIISRQIDGDGWDAMGELQVD